MAKTVRFKVYLFSELKTEKAKKAARWWWQAQNTEEDEELMEEAYDSLRKFVEIMPVKSVEYYDFASFKPHSISAIVKLKDETSFLGQQLSTYIRSKYSEYLFTDNKESHNCVLTGKKWDEILLAPIYQFLKTPEEIDFKTLIYRCFIKLANGVGKELAERSKDETIDKLLIENKYYFTKDGNRYTG